MPVQTQMGSRGIAVQMCNISVGWGCVVTATLRPLYARERAPYTRCGVD
jgi:hypothetical protein